MQFNNKFGVLLRNIGCTKHAGRISPPFKPKQTMKKLTKTSLAIYSLGVLSGIGVAISAVTNAEDSIIPYVFKDGQVISADTLNDLFSQIRDANRGVSTEAELQGTWSCSTYDPAPAQGAFQAANFVTDSATGLRKLNQTWVFSNAGTSLSMNLARAGGIQYNYTGVCPTQSTFQYSARVVESALMLTGSDSCSTGQGFVAPLTKVSPYKFRVALEKTIVACVLTNQPPAIPTNLSATKDSSGVVISWTENGGNPTEFRILKKTNGAYAQIGTSQSGSTSYTDTSGIAGDLYRVQAVNSVGSSLSSVAVLAN